MLVLEFRTYGKTEQFKAIDEAIRICQFIRNKSIRLWMDGGAKSCFDLNRHCAIWSKEFDFANKLGAMARQASAERAWASISRFYDNVKKGVKGKKVGFPRFQKDCRSVEYKTNSWKLSDNRKSITFTDKCGIGRLKMKGTRDLDSYNLTQIKRVRLVKRADGYYVQFCVNVDRLEVLPSTSQTIGLDVGLRVFYTDSNGEIAANPKFLRNGEVRLTLAQRLVSRKVKGSSNRLKARVILGKRHLKISRQRKDHAIKLARCVITSNDVVVYEDLRMSNMLKNHCLAKSISDTSWYQFRIFLEYFGKMFGRITIAVNPAYTSQECSNCGEIVKKSLSTRTHACKCGCEMDRDHNAAVNILNRGIGTTGHVETSLLDSVNA
jgi:putative transposase